MPKYAALIYSEEMDPNTPPDPEATAQVMAEYMEFGQANGQHLAGGEALYPSSTATTVTVREKGGTPTFTDGPFAETKEVLGGFYLINADDLDGALAVAQQIPGAWHGKIEVRPVMEFDEQGNQIA
jgi:hypothetical protein